MHMLGFTNDYIREILDKNITKAKLSFAGEDFDFEVHGKKRKNGNFEIYFLEINVDSNLSVIAYNGFSLRYYGESNK